MKKKTVKKIIKEAKRTSRKRSHVLKPSPSAANKVRMKVLGIGGGGSNAIMRMEGIRGTDFIAINTDIQDLEKSDVRRKIHIGKVLTKGMGAGMNPELGKLAAEENRAEIAEALQETDMVFLTAGFGGGTGSGATHVIADIARELGILTVAIVTKPFAFEGQARMRIAEEAVGKLKDRVDALLIIPNDRIFNVIDAETSIYKSFEKIDEILKSAVQGITEIISATGLVNVDFADLKAVISGAGNAIIGVGAASGKGRAVKATTEAINSPLLESSISGARGVIFCVVANRDLKMSEVDEAAKIITTNVDPNAKIIFGAYNDRKLKQGQLKVIVIAAGFDGVPGKSSGDSLISLFPIDNKVNLKTNDHAKKQVLSKEPIKDSLKETTKIPVENKIETKAELKAEAKAEKKEEKMAPADEDMWDIPAFLRKRRK